MHCHNDHKNLTPMTQQIIACHLLSHPSKLYLCLISKLIFITKGNLYSSVNFLSTDRLYPRDGIYFETLVRGSVQATVYI